MTRCIDPARLTFEVIEGFQFAEVCAVDYALQCIVREDDASPKVMHDTLREGVPGSFVAPLFQRVKQVEVGPATGVFVQGRAPSCWGPRRCHSGIDRKEIGVMDITTGVGGNDTASCASFGRGRITSLVVRLCGCVFVHQEAS